MKELNQFIRWADSVSNSYLVEADVDKKKSSRALNTGIQSIAQRQYPDLDPQEALITYMGQKLSDMEEKDAEQIKLLNRQSQETNKLMNTVQGIRAAYDELERSSQEVEQEIDQIRGGAERAKLGQEQNTISARDVRELLNTVEELKKNPNVDKREYRELVDSVKSMTDSNVSKEQYEALKQQLEQAQSDENPELSSIHADIEKLKQEYGEKIAGAENIRSQLQKYLLEPDFLEQNPFMKQLGSEVNSLEEFMQDQIDDIDSKIENLPSEEELAVLKTVPVQVSQINQRVDKNDELDNQQNQQIEQVKDIADTAEMMISNLRLRDSQRYASLHDLANHIISLRKEIQKATGKKIDSTDSIDFINNLRRESREQALNRLARERSINRRQLQPRIREKSTDKSLPESYLKEIDTLAERILGEQYGKYLK
jgi:hypothetical protein